VLLTWECVSALEQTSDSKFQAPKVLTLLACLLLFTDTTPSFNCGPGTASCIGVVQNGFPSPFAGTQFGGPWIDFLPVVNTAYTQGQTCTRYFVGQSLLACLLAAVTPAGASICSAMLYLFTSNHSPSLLREHKFTCCVLITESCARHKSCNTIIVLHRNCTALYPTCNRLQRAKRLLRVHGWVSVHPRWSTVQQPQLHLRLDHVRCPLHHL
jgi:hypothetical protein